MANDFSVHGWISTCDGATYLSISEWWPCTDDRVGKIDKRHEENSGLQVTMPITIWITFAKMLVSHSITTNEWMAHGVLRSLCVCVHRPLFLVDAFFLWLCKCFWGNGISLNDIRSGMLLYAVYGFLFSIQFSSHFLFFACFCFGDFLFAIRLWCWNSFWT